jgi:hypothetical protein
MMNRNFIFVFILLAMVSIVNSFPPQLYKRATVFEQCSKSPPIIVSEIEPDPLVPGKLGKFHVSGNIAKTIPKGSTLTANFVNVDSDPPTLIDKIDAYICLPNGILDCPYPAKTPFSGVLSGTVTPALPKSYAILVLLEDANREVLGCSRAFVGGAQPLPNTSSAAPTPTAPTSPPPPPASSSPPSPSPSSTEVSGKGAGGIQDSLVNKLLNL